MDDSMVYDNKQSNLTFAQVPWASFAPDIKTHNLRSVGCGRDVIWFSSQSDSEGMFNGLPDYNSKSTGSESLDLSILEGKRVLVVDDEPVIRHMLKAFFTKAGANVIDAANGSEAVRIFTEDTLDLVVMDVVMPGLDGITAAIRMHEQKAKIPVVLASGYTEEQKIPELLKNGVVKFYMRKPYSRKGILLAAIQAIQAGEDENTTLV